MRRPRDLKEQELISARDHLVRQGKYKEAANYRRILNEREMERRRELFESLVEEVDFSEGGLGKAYKLLDRVSGKRPMYRERLQKLIMENGRVLQNADEEREAFLRQYCEDQPRPDPEREKSLTSENDALFAKLASLPGSKIEVTTHQIEAAFRKIRVNAAAGPDAVSSRQLKNCPPVARDAFARLAESSLALGKIPGRWREEETVPLPKGGKTLHERKHYRPVSLTSACCKVCERVVLGFIASEYEFFKTQTGYAKGRSTTENVAILIAEIETAFVKGEVLVAVFIDFSGAFERISHARVVNHFLRRAEKLGSGRLAKVAGWIRDFLQGRKRRVRWRGGFSSVGEVVMGAPQGTVLGPVLFKAYLDPLLRALDREGIRHIAYADDITLYCRSCSLTAATQAVQRGVDIVEQWCKKENMEISKEKTVVTVYGQGLPNKCGLRVAGSPAVHADCPRYLGVLLDRNLTFKPHVKRVLGNARRRLRAVRMLATASWKPRSVHVYTLYNGVVESALFNAAGAWLPRAGSEVWKELERVQAEGAALILGVPGRLCARDVMLHEAGLVPATQVAGREAGLLVCTAKSRTAREDPLPGCLELDRASWVVTGNSVLVNSRVKLWPIEKESQFQLGTSNDHWKHIRTGALDVRVKEAQLADVEEAHADGSAAVYYTDGAAAYGRGAASYAKKEAASGRPSGSVLDKVFCVPLRTVADAFASEEWALYEALCDASQDLSPGERVVVFTDALSVLQSLLAAGVRDQIENKIVRQICSLCGDGHPVQLSFVRSHSGWIGNEVADSLARRGRTIEEWYPHGRQMPMYIAKSRLCNWAKSEQRVGLTPSRGGSSSLHSLAGSTGLSRNPLLGDSGAFNVTRRTECVYNQLRVGCATFAHGFRRWSAGKKPVCPGCGGESSCKHFLLCCPVLAPQRERMTKHAKEEAEEKHGVAVERAVSLGRKPPKPPVWRGLEMCAVSKFPFSVLQYISECRVWLDAALGATVVLDPDEKVDWTVRARAMRRGWERV
jgi:ribonuclease HI